MATKITEYTELTTPAAGDLLEIVDVSDTTMAATGTNKKIQFSNVGGSGGGGGGAVRTASGQWHASPYARGVIGSDVWVIQHRMHFTPHFAETARSISDLSVYVTGAGAAGVVVRFAIYSSDAVSAMPATVLYQTTVAADAAGVKTISGLSVGVSGLYWIGSVSQGSGTVATCWSHAQMLYALPIGTVTADNNNALNQWVWYVDGITGAAPNAPGVVLDGNLRMPAVLVKYA